MALIRTGKLGLEEVFDAGRHARKEPVFSRAHSFAGFGTS